MRYELKIPFEKNHYDTIIKNLYTGKHIVREIFKERQINNIYFDTLSHSDYCANVDGNHLRKKYRIRWYGELREMIKEPVLELKYKRGMEGGKKYSILPMFEFNESFSFREYFAVLRKSLNVPETEPERDWMIGELLQRNPTLVNHYKRRYFTTTDEKFRITLDKDVWYCNPIIAAKGKSGVFGCFDSRVILELKFDATELKGASALINELGYRIGKNSKYVNGVEAVYHNRIL